MNKNKLILIATILGLSLIAIPANIKAQSDAPYKMLAPLPCIENPDTTYVDEKGQTQTIPGIKCDGGNGAIKEEIDFKTYVQYTFNLLIALSAVVAVVMIIWGGIEYMTYDSFQKKADGKQRIQNALFGLLLILTSYLILRTVDPRLVEIPNTLVPQIEIADWLAQDRVSLLMGQLQNEINQYNIKSAEIGQRLQATAQQKAEKLNELEKVNKELNEFDHGAPGAAEKYSALQVKKAQLERDLSDIGINFTKELAESAMNGVLITATNEIAQNIKTPEEAIRLLNKNKKLIQEYRDTATADLMRKGEIRPGEINNVANYTETMLDVMRFEIIVNSASRGISGGVGPYGSSANNISLTTLEGTFKIFSPSDAKLYLNKELDRIKSVQSNNITNQKLKDDLQIKITEIENYYKEKPLFK